MFLIVNREILSCYGKLVHAEREFFAFLLKLQQIPQMQVFFIFILVKL